MSTKLYIVKKVKKEKIICKYKKYKIEKYKFKKNFFDFVVDRGSLTCLKYNSLKTTVNKINLSLKKFEFFFLRHIATTQHVMNQK